MATDAPAVKRQAAAAGLVATTYVYFLIFAQFAFLKLLVASGTAVRPVMALMAAAGLAGSVLAAWRHRAERVPAALQAGFALAAGGAALALLAQTPAGFAAAAAFTGLGLGLVTVNLAATLRGLVGGTGLGAAIGWGTGVAYAISNIPMLFEARPELQTAFALVVAALGVLVTRNLRPAAPGPFGADPDYRPSGLVCWVAVFTALVWADSAVFNVIQGTDALRRETWAGPWQLWVNAATHLAAAVLAGWALDRGWLGRSVLLAAAMLLGAGGLIGGAHGRFALGALLYTAGVSIYSTALVFFPAQRGEARLAALVYVVAGWIGSALGIGMVQDRHGIPAGFPIFAGGVVTCALASRYFLRRREGA